MLALNSKFLKSLSILLLAGGCASSGSPLAVVRNEVQPPIAVTPHIPVDAAVGQDAKLASSPPSVAPVQLVTHEASDSSDALHGFELLARERNPRLIRLHHEYQAALAKSRYADKLPDPRFGANIFGDPIETAAGSQRANMTFSQAVPWIARLRADEQRAIFDAYAIHAELEAETLRVEAAVRTQWYRLYVLEKQIEIAVANQQLLTSLIDVANARIATGAASQGDVLLGTLELSQLEERLLTLRRQRQGTVAEFNRLLAQSAETPIASPERIHSVMPTMDTSELTQIALHSQPEIEAAKMRTQATRWGVEVARLMRRPEFMLSASYYPTDNNRPPSNVVDVGQDPWALGAQISIPIWRDKYDAIEDEALWKHQAAHNTVEELSDRYASLIVDLVAEAKRAQETAELYESTILPQAQQTLKADQESYSNGAVEFDRVIRDYRNLLTLEIGYHQAIGDMATAIAKIYQTTGVRTGP
ncbi:TolC family protein [Blastopirellula sp. JC732]|uniref:TolC family protein n=1 Tax=Blastopirellula sediminis TaxID=2894196 RepID=A0A9X1MJT1_9BACT|nr:TolC family protein [Blastopirellula sediminis]MCC9608780.1 TolC family protein [Blastopirellula sediminis]MCC9628443.1 TolC family protein [Blastopirellula sediminis]